jgi:hypothetical protein
MVARGEVLYQEFCSVNMMATSVYGLRWALSEGGDIYRDTILGFVYQSTHR